MTIRIAFISYAVAASVFASPAFGQSPIFASVGLPIMNGALLIMMIGMFVLAVFSVAAMAQDFFSFFTSSRTSCDCDECRTKSFQKQTELMREITRQQDTHTAMMRSEIDLTRMSGVYGERPDIAAHEQRLRELRQLLQEGSKT